MASSFMTTAALALLLAACQFDSTNAARDLKAANGRGLNHDVLSVPEAAAPTTTKPASVPTPTPTPSPADNILDSAAASVLPTYYGGDWRGQLLSMVNQARAAQGARPLCYNYKLNAACQAQSDSGIYSHTWTFVYAMNYGSSYLGQNIAKGQNSPSSVFTAWYNSPLHRSNMLNPYFTQMGAGWNTGSNMWTQNFGGFTGESCS